jgi:uncharacterized protein
LRPTSQIDISNVGEVLANYHELTWIPPTGTLTATIFGQLLAETSPSGNMITDAQLAAVAIEHGIAVVSADSDFARFTRVRWINPFAA